jgi:hypothetical protein
MDARLNLVDNPGAAKFLKHIISAGKVSRTRRCQPQRRNW